MESRKNTVLLSEIHRNIGNRLSYRDCQSYATTCSSTFFSLDNHFFQKKEDREEYLSDRFKTIIDSAYFAVKKYIMYDNSIHCRQLYFNKGQYRSVRFMLILDPYHLPHPSMQFSLLALYTLLKEKNGTILKTQVIERLKSISIKIGYIEKYVMEAYSSDQSTMKLLQDHILKRIYTVYNNDRHPFNFSKEEIAKLEIEINTLAHHNKTLTGSSCNIL